MSENTPIEPVGLPALQALNWQPIETIPKEGPPILVYWQKSITGEPTIDLVGPAEYLEILGYGEPPATHWMPLPDPPVGLSSSSERPESTKDTKDTKKI